MYCKNCGKGIPPQAAFCPHCGTETLKNNSGAIAVPLKKTSKFHRKLFAPLSILVVLLVGAAILLTKMSADNKISSKLQGTDWWWSSGNSVVVLRLNPDGTGIWVTPEQPKLTMGIITYTIEKDHLIVDEYDENWLDSLVVEEPVDDLSNYDKDVIRTDFCWDKDSSQFVGVTSIPGKNITSTLAPANPGTFASETLRAESYAESMGEYPDDMCVGIGDYYEGKLYNTLCQGYWYIYDDDIITRWNCCIELTFNPNGVGSMKLRDLTTGEISMNPYGAGNNINNAQYAPFFYKLDEDHVYIVMIDGDLLLCSLQDGKLVTVQDSEFQIAPILHYKSRPDISAIQADSETAKHK